MCRIKLLKMVCLAGILFLAVWLSLDSTQSDSKKEINYYKLTPKEIANEKSKYLSKLNAMSSESTEVLEKQIVDWVNSQTINVYTASDLIARLIDMTPSKLDHPFQILSNELKFHSSTSTDRLVRTFSWCLRNDIGSNKVYIKSKDIVHEIDFIKLHLTDKSYGGDITFNQIDIDMTSDNGCVKYIFNLVYDKHTAEMLNEKNCKEIYFIDENMLVRENS